ncbi:MAG: hypothetical protein IKD92_08665 [Lachnospiraceae bacterium]|nr:hypothetical protein [Lachnospiraceae bacterium]
MGSFPATEKLFDTNAYAVEFDAKVLSASLLDQKKQDSLQTWELILDRTLFFPEEGGQTPDTGEINGCPVTDVQLDGDVIRHAVCVPEQVSFSPGSTIHGKIDFAHRFSNMQNHSGEHILSGLAHSRFGCDNVGFHLSDNTVTLDFNRPLTDTDILWMETAANRVVWDNREIRGWYPDPEELETIEYRSKKEIDGPLRLVEIPGVDMCACCAPHVKRTGEIGLIKIIRTLRERDGIRLTILCGERALAYLQAQQQEVEEVSHLTNMPREKIGAGVSRILEDNEKLRQRSSDLEAQVTKALAAAVPEGQEDVFLFADGIGNLAQRRLVNDLCAAHPGYCGVFIGTDTDGYRYIIGAGEDAADAGKSAAGAGMNTNAGKNTADAETNAADAGKNFGGAGKKAGAVTAAKKKDARVLNACLHKACGARGGGKPAMVQGSVRAAQAQILTTLEKALHEVEGD